MLVEHVVAHVLQGSAFAGYRVAVLGDFHIAPWRSTNAIAQAVQIINRWRPDLVALVGDYGHSVRGFQKLSGALYRRALPRVTAQLASLRAADAVCAVLGNHDNDAGSDVVSAALTRVGIHVLRNERREIARDDAVLGIVGIDDRAWKHRPLDALFASPLVPNATLVLSHHPDFVRHCSQDQLGSPTIVVAGHTHGGQIRFPQLGAPVTLSRVATRAFPGGFVPNECATLYVTRGLGEQVPLRLLAPREVTLLELAER